VRLSSLAPAYPPYDTEETNMVGKRAVKSGREIEFISARLPTLRDIPSIRFITRHKEIGFQIPRRLWRSVSTNQIKAA